MLRTPVSQLQELTVHKKLAAPDYEIKGTGMAHCMSFICHVKAGNETAMGEGATKKDAKHNAAKNILKKFGIIVDYQVKMSPCLLPSKSSKLAEGPMINYVGKLNEFCSTNRHPQPTYTDNLTVSNKFCIICTFNNYKSEGYGNNKKEAKQDAAKNMFALITNPEDDTLIKSESSPINKLEDTYIENKAMSEQVLKTYTKMMKNINVKDNKDEDNLKNIEKEVNVSTWDELIELLNQQGYKHELTTFQKYPLILSLKINEHVLMNSGISKEIICEKLVIDVVNMIRQGVDFSKPAFDL